ARYCARDNRTRLRNPYSGCKCGDGSSRKCRENEVHRASPRTNRQSGDGHQDRKYRGHADPATAEPVTRAWPEPASSAECPRTFRPKLTDDAVHIGIREFKPVRISSGELSENRDT